MTEAPAQAPFFVSGGTVPPEAASYVVRDADRALLDALRAGRYAYVLTSRQMGKSSLCVRTMAALQAEGARTAFVDLTRVGGRNVSAEQWYAGLLGEVGRGLGARAAMLAHWKAHPELGPMQRFFGALREVALDAPLPLVDRQGGGVGGGGDSLSDPSPQPSPPEGRGSPVVVFIDEIDATRSLPFSTDEFFAGIRECFNRRVQDPAFGRLAFCLLGVAVPSDLIADATLTPFNVGERIVLRDFSLAEALPLAAGLGAGGEALVERIVHWTGGHPFLTQSLGRRLAEEPSPLGEGRVGVSTVDRLVADEFFEARARETHVNLADVGNRVLNSYDDPDGVAKYRADILSLYERVLRGKRVADDESNRLVAVLKLAGLVRAESGVLKVRNRVYERVFGRDWVRENMPNQELRRQRAAARAAALRIGALATAVVAAMAFLAGAAVRNARTANAALGLMRVEKARADRLTEQARAEAIRAARAETQALGSAAKARAEGRRATDALADAQTQKARADDQAGLARRNETVANGQKARADGAAKAARASATLATREKGRADAEARAARENEALAKNQTRLAIASANEAESQSYEAYVNAVQSADMALDGGRFDLTQSILRSLQASPWRGWEYDYLSERTLEGRGLTVAAHSDGVPCVAFAEGGRQVVSSGWGGEIAVWQADDGHSKTRFTVPPGVRGFTMLPSGHELVLLCASGELARYDLRTHARAWTVDTGDTASWLACSPDGNLVATCAEKGRVRLWRTAGGGAAGSFLLGDADLYSIIFSPDGQRLATVGGDGKVVVSDLQGKALRTFEGLGNDVAFSADGRLVASGGGEGTVRVWDVDGGEKVTEWKESAIVFGVVRAPTGDAWGVATGDGRVTLRGLRSGALLAQNVPSVPVISQYLAFSPDGERIAVGGDDGTVRVLASHPLEVNHIVARRPGEASSLAADVRSNRVFVSHAPPKGNRLTALALDSGKELWAKDFPKTTYDFYAVALSPDARRIALPTIDGKLLILDAQDGRTLRALSGNYAARFTPDSRQVAVSAPDGVRFYDVESGALRRTVPLARRTLGLAISPDGGTLATGSDDGTIRLWSLRVDSPPVVLSGHSAAIRNVSFDAGGRRLVSSGLDGIRAWDLRTNALTQTIRTPAARGGTAAFLPDGKRIVIQTLLAGTTLLDARTGREFVRLEGSGGGRTVCVLDERRILVGYGDGTVRLFEGISAKDREALRDLQRQDDRREGARRTAEAAQIRSMAYQPRLDRALAKRRYDEALAIYGKVLAQEPGLLTARSARADLLAQIGRYADALKEYQALDGRTPLPGDDLTTLWRSTCLRTR